MNKIGNTNLNIIRTKNGNNIIIKEEFKNPSGSHYDRIYRELFKNIDKTKCKHLVEISSGNAAVSFANFCKIENFKCTIILPKEVYYPNSFFKEIEHCEIIRSKYNDYIKGANKSLKEYLIEHKNSIKKGELIFLNHSHNENSLLGIETLGFEIVESLNKKEMEIDYFLPACGNGLSIIGPSNVLKKEYKNIRVIAFESKSAPVGFPIKYPERFHFYYKNEKRKHHLFGTSAYGINFPFLQDPKYNFKNIVDDIILINDFEWYSVKSELKELGYNVGNTSMVAYYLAKKIDKFVKNKSILIIFYDKRSKNFKI